MSLSLFSVQPLGVKHLTFIMSLQKNILQALPIEHQNYIVPKHENDFQKFTMGPYHAIGILHEEQLIAQSMIAYVLPEDDNKNLTSCDAARPIIDHPTGYGVIEGVLVHPDYRKIGLMTRMVESAIEMLKQQYQCERLYAEIAVGNHASRRGFEKNGFQIVAEGIDPSDDCELWYMQHMPYTNGDTLLFV